MPKRKQQAKSTKKKLPRNNRLICIAKFIAPIAAMLLFIGFAYLILDYKTFSNVFYLTTLETFSPFSTELSAPVGIGFGLELPMIMLILVFVNVVISVFVVLNYDTLKLIPKVGKLFYRFDNKMKKAIKKYELGKITFVGLFLYFLSPLHASGSFTIGILGKLLQMENWKILVIVILGTIIGTIIFSTAMIGLLALLGF